MKGIITVEMRGGPVSFCAATTMIHDVVSARYVGDHRIELTFDDGKHGTVDFSKYLTRGGVFERFRDLDYFKRFKIDPDLGVLSWDGEVDIAPETLDAEATGAPLPEWMERTDLAESGPLQQSPVPSHT